MANPIIVTPDSVPDPNGCLPGTRQEMINFVAQYLSVTFGTAGGTNYGFIVTGSATPTPEQQTSMWFKTETSGRPIGWFYFFNGKWTRTGIPLNSIMYYQGPSSNFNTGKGLAGTQVEGFLLCNGNNGTPDMTNKFIVGAANYTTAWVTNVDPENPSATTGGASTVRLTRAQIPELPVTLPVGTGVDGAFNRFNYGQASAGTGFYAGTINGTGDGSGAGDDLSPAAAHNNLPPFFASAPIMFQPFA